MVNEEIFFGIKNAVSNGESLGSAMNSFFNAGYKKEEIEEAARAVQKGLMTTQKPEIKKPTIIKKIIMPKDPKPKTIQDKMIINIKNSLVKEDKNDPLEEIKRNQAKVSQYEKEVLPPKNPLASNWFWIAFVSISLVFVGIAFFIIMKYY